MFPSSNLTSSLRGVHLRNCDNFSRFLFLLVFSRFKFRQCRCSGGFHGPHLPFGWSEFKVMDILPTQMILSFSCRWYVPRIIHDWWSKLCLRCLAEITVKHKLICSWKCSIHSTAGGHTEQKIPENESWNENTFLYKWTLNVGCIKVKFAYQNLTGLSLPQEAVWQKFGIK